MRTIFLILIVAVLLLIAAVATGLVDLRLKEPAVAPAIERDGGRITARPGQAPAFDVETGSIGVGTAPAKVPVPTVEVKRGEARIGLPRVEVRRPATQNQAQENQANAAQ